MDKLNIEIGQKITILKPGELVPLLIAGKVEGFNYGKYAQYENSIFIYIRRPRRKHLDRIVIHEHETAFIFDGTFKDMHRKEKVNENMTNLHRWTYNDLKDNKNLIFYHCYGEKLQIENNFERFIDVTADYISDNNVNPREAEQNEGYINYIKEKVKNYNIDSLKSYLKNEGYYDILIKCIDKAIIYNW